MTTGRRPYLSTSLPETGDPIAVPIVLAMVINPALT
jgi:hypothetical protein